MEPLTKAERYLRRAEECIALAKVATSNKVRAHHYAIAERYLRLAEAEPTVTNRGRWLGSQPYSIRPSLPDQLIAHPASTPAAHLPCDGSP